jgi:hypothetical protein
MLDDKDIDAVVVSSCNHWHCLASIWAMQAQRGPKVQSHLPSRNATAFRSYASRNQKVSPSR